MDEIFAKQLRHYDNKELDQYYNNNTNVCMVNSDSITQLKFSIMLWHRRLAHISFKKIIQMSSHKLVEGLPNFSKLLPYCQDFICVVCLLSKMRTKNIPKEIISRFESDDIHSAFTNEYIEPIPRQPLQPLVTWYIDCMGPFQCPSIGNNLYVVTAVDSFSRVVIAKTISVKKAAYLILNIIDSLAKLHKTQVRVIKTDNGGEFISRLFENIVQERSW
jgi:hypothetical protein